MEFTQKIEEQNVWDYLKSDHKPIVMYGMGNAAEKMVNILKKYNIEVADFFASDEFVRGHSFLGKKVLTYAEICKKYDDFNVVLAFATHIESVLKNIEKINQEHQVFAPDIPVAGSGLFTKEYLIENKDKFNQAYALLADEESRRVYENVVNFKVSGKVNYLYNTFCDKNDIYKNILKLGSNESIVDLGAYDGDTIREFTAYTNGKYNSITAFEPDAKNFKKLQNATKDMQGVSLYNIGAWNKEDTLIFDKQAGRNSHISASGVPIKVCDVDSVVKNNVSLLKMDIEGSEMKALEGVEKTIKKYLPKLYVCAYHRNEDLYALPLKIHSVSDQYKIYFRHSVYIPAWESNFYCVVN